MKLPPFVLAPARGRATVRGRGVEEPPPTKRRYRIEFTADGKLELRLGSGDGAVRPTRPRPRAMDYGKTGCRRAIYKFEKDKLVICFAEGKRDRPTKFESPVGTRIMLMTLKRVEKKKE